MIAVRRDIRRVAVCEKPFEWVDHILIAHLFSSLWILRSKSAAPFLDFCFDRSTIFWIRLSESADGALDDVVAAHLSQTTGDVRNQSVLLVGDIMRYRFPAWMKSSSSA